MSKIEESVGQTCNFESSLSVRKRIRDESRPDKNRKKSLKMRKKSLKSLKMKEENLQDQVHRLSCFSCHRGVSCASSTSDLIFFINIFSHSQTRALESDRIRHVLLLPRFHSCLRVCRANIRFIYK